MPDKFRDPDALEDHHREDQLRWEREAREAKDEKEREHAEREAKSAEREADSMRRISDHQKEWRKGD